MHYIGKYLKSHVDRLSFDLNQIREQSIKKKKNSKYTTKKFSNNRDVKESLHRSTQKHKRNKNIYLRDKLLELRYKNPISKALGPGYGVGILGISNYRERQKAAEAITGISFQDYTNTKSYESRKQYIDFFGNRVDRQNRDYQNRSYFPIVRNKKRKRYFDVNTLNLNHVD